MRKRLLIVVTGPVSSGKSTTASALAVCFRSRGLTTAVIGLDEMYLMAGQGDDFRDPKTWATARRGCAELAGSFFISGLDIVREKEGQMMVRNVDPNRAVGGTRGWSQS